MSFGKKTAQTCFSPYRQEQKHRLQSVGFTSELSDETLMSCGEGPRREHITRSSTIYSIAQQLGNISPLNASRMAGCLPTYTTPMFFHQKDQLALLARNYRLYAKPKGSFREQPLSTTFSIAVLSVNSRFFKHRYVVFALG